MATATVALFVWETKTALLGAANVVGVAAALAILSIVFGTVSLLYTLGGSRAIHAIRRCSTANSPDRRIQAVPIA